MDFTARLRRYSATWKLWREAHRTGGVLAGVQFSWATGNDYVTGPLSGPQVVALRGHADAEIEVAGPAGVPAASLPSELVKPDDPVAAEPRPRDAAPPASAAPLPGLPQSNKGRGAGRMGLS